MSMQAAVRKELATLTLPAMVEDHVSEMVAGALEEGLRTRQLVTLLLPLLADSSIEEEKLSDVCHNIHAACFPNEGDDDDTEELDHLVDCRGVILAYAGKTLLKPTNLQLLRNHRYGVVGNNGVGKTTLLNRIASREVSNFPQNIKVLYIQHEVYVDLDCTVVDFMEQQQRTEGTDKKLIQDALASIGFTEERMASPVAELSGGWRMKLAIATAVTQKCDLLLLDEPTNHLDAASRAWLADYLVTLTNTTVCIVSHDYEFLGKTCTDVMHIANLQLTYYGGGFANFAMNRPDVMEALPTMTESGASAVITLPDPGKLDGVKSKSKPVVEAKDLTFFYPNSEKPTLEKVNAKLCVKSRVGLLGVNGAGKTTLLRLLVGDAAVDQGTGKHAGEIARHQNLRVAYIAQSSMHHLEEHLHMKPWQYVQERFRTGLDKELAKRETMRLTPEEEALRCKIGNIKDIVGRAIRGGELSYETVRAGREDDGTFWEPLGSIKRKDPYVMKLCLNYDAKLQAYQSGAEIRPCTEREILKHLADFGLSHRLAQSVWNKPHLIALDEPTNYLDNETLNALAAALQKFDGAILAISHHQNFVSRVCNELWKVEGGQVVVTQTAKEGRSLQRGGSDNSLSSMDRIDSQNSLETSSSVNSMEDGK